MNYIKKYLAVVIICFITINLLNLSALAAVLRVIETGSDYGNATFEGGNWDGWTSQGSQTPVIGPDENSNRLIYSQTSTQPGMIISKTFAQPLTGVVALETKVKLSDSTFKRYLFKLTDSSGAKLDVMHVNTYFRLADTTGGFNFAIAPLRTNSWQTIRIIIDFNSTNKAVWYYVDGVLITKHVTNGTAVPSSLLVKLKDIKTLQMTTDTGTGSSFLDDIRIFPVAMADYDKLTLQSSTPEDNAVGVSEERDIVLAFNNEIPDNMLTTGHFNISSNTGNVPTYQIIKESDQKTVRLKLDGDLDFNTGYTVNIVDLVDIHGLAVEKLNQAISFTTQDGYLKVTGYEIFKDNVNISESGLTTGILKAKVRIRNFGTEGTTSAAFVVGLYKKNQNNILSLEDIISTPAMDVSQGERRDFEADLTVPGEVAGELSDYFIQLHVVNNITDIRPIAETKYFSNSGFVEFADIVGN